ncbi:MAG: UDP-N-acetylmuramoyl-tripeptide--D-alanyl-D-alanine ligase [Candidatus Methylomirabilales bacterium]
MAARPDPDQVTAAEISEACDGRLLGGSPGWPVRSFSTDTRTLAPGDLFIALQGKRFDGHAYLAAARERGAIGAVVADAAGSGPWPGALWVGVRETQWALGQIAHLWRTRHRVRVTGVTGTNGKTMTKEMIGAILAQAAGREHVFTSPGNLNNLVGLPLSLLRVRRQHRMAVVEMGMSARGEIDRLATIALPDVGVITNIGEGHLEFLGSVGEVALAKGELLRHLTGNRVAVLNLDDPYSHGLLPAVRGELLTFGMNTWADVRAEKVRLGRGAGFDLCYGGDRVRVRLLVPGSVMVLNALAAAAAAVAMGVGLTTVAAGLHRLPAIPMRMERFRHRSGAIIVNDAYNANPTSMQAALETFFQMSRGRSQILILGSMLELGAVTGAAHRRIGATAAAGRPARLITVGREAEAIAEGARAAGLDSRRIQVCPNAVEAVRYLRPWLRRGIWILLKGSRGMALERLLEGL